MGALAKANKFNYGRPPSTAQTIQNAERDFGIDLPDVALDNGEYLRAYGIDTPPHITQDQTAHEAIGQQLGQRGLQLNLPDQRVLSPVAQTVVLQKLKDGTIDQPFLNQLAQNKDYTISTTPSTFNQITKGLMMAGASALMAPGFVKAGAAALGVAEAANQNKDQAKGPESSSSDSSGGSSYGSPSTGGTGTGTDTYNFDSPNFDPLAGNPTLAGAPTFDPYAIPASGLPGTTVPGNSSIPSFLEPLKDVWNAVPQSIKNGVSDLFGGLLGGGGDILNTALGAYRGYEAANAVSDAIDNAKQSSQQYYGQAQDYMAGGMGTARQDLITGAQQASDTLRGYSDQGRGDILSTLAQSRSDVAPWYEGGKGALATQMGLMGVGQMPGGQTPQQYLEQTPGYQWQMDQGMKALNGNMAARGLSTSGAEMQEMNKFAQGLASTTFDQRLNQLAQLSNLGAGIGQQMGQNQMAAGQSLSNLAYNTGTGLGNYAYGTGQGLADIAFKGGAGQSNLAQQQGEQMGSYDVAKGALQSGAISGAQSGSPLLDLAMIYNYGRR